MNKTKEWIKKNQFYIAGTFFIILQLFLIYKYTHITRFSNMLWFCSHTPLIFGIAFFTKNTTIIKTLISVGLIPQVLWVIDYLVKIFFGFFILGATDYMFMDISGLSYTISIVEHFFAAPLALFLTYKYKTKKKVLLYALIYLVLLLTLTLTLSGEEFNYNLTRFIPIGEGITFTGYTYFWIILTMLIVVIPTYYFQIFLQRQHEKKQRKKRRKNL